MVSKETDEDFLFLAEDEAEVTGDELKLGEWQLLIVDDDEEIHTVTKLALSDLTVLGKRLVFNHAYSGAEAIAFLRQHPNTALVLLDVVMESDNAGLLVVQQIRDELQMDEVRIVLRTGQPGYAPEESVIKEYDINDYTTKNVESVETCNTKEELSILRWTVRIPTNSCIICPSTNVAIRTSDKSSPFPNLRT